MSKHTEQVTVVVVNWNGIDLIAECLTSLLAQSVSCRIVLVDNGSTDGSQELIRKRFKTVTLIELDHNTGFTGGVNAGIEDALAHGADFVALINNDAVADSSWLENLLAEAR
jgi:GT2 family glycosyltransferase